MLSVGVRASVKARISNDNDFLRLFSKTQFTYPPNSFGPQIVLALWDKKKLSSNSYENLN